MNLIDRKNGKKLRGVIEKVSKDDFEIISKTKNFGFNWSLEFQNQVYKIRLNKNEEVLGLISIIDCPKELRIHINLIESSKINRGKNKEVLNIPGCLIAFACKISFKNGYDGFVSLTPKTQLIKYYSKTYGFIQFGVQMAVLQEISESIIQKYIGDEEI